MRELTGKVVALTGAGSGLGRALARALAHEGACLALSDIDADGLAEAARIATVGSGQVSTHVVDVADRAAVERWAAATIDEHGRADMLIGNAGVGCVATVADASYADFDWVLGVNLWGVIHGVKAFLPHLLERPEAHIVTVASINAFLPFPTSGPYNVAKSGAEALSETLMSELAGSDVVVSTAYPGGVRTSISENARYTTPADDAGFERRALTSPERAAGVIVAGIKRNRRRMYVGIDARLMALAQRLFPAGMRRFVTWGWRRTVDSDA